MRSARKVKYRFADEGSIPEKIIIGEKAPDAVSTTDPDYRGFECIAPMHPELAYRIRVLDIDLPVKDALLPENPLDLFTFRIFFLRIENHFYHDIPTSNGTDQKTCGNSGQVPVRSFLLTKKGWEDGINWTDTHGSIMGWRKFNGNFRIFPCRDHFRTV